MFTLKQRRRIGAKAVSLPLFILPLPLALKALLSLWTGNAAVLVAASLCWLLFVVAAVVCRRGMQAELQEEERPVSARRAGSLKLFGGILAAVAAGLTAFFVAGHDLPISLAFAAVCFLGCQLLYGSHRRATRRPKDEEAPDEETKRLLRDAYRRLDGIEAARRQIHSAEFDQRLASVVAGAEKVIDLIVRDPADLRRARKFLTVYLEGAERIAKDYARTHAHAGSADLEHNFRTLLVDLENTCEEQYQKLLKHDVSDLELQIEVLSTRLRREGVT